MEKDARVVLMDRLASDEATATEFATLVDRIAPGAIAAARQGEAISKVVEARLSDIDKTKAELDKQLASTRMRNEIDDARRKLLTHPFAAEHGLTAADLAGIEKIMLDPESGTTSHLAAAKLYVSSRMLGAPRAEYDPGIQFPRNDMGEYWAGQGKGRGITDGPNPRQMGEAWARDRATQDIKKIMNRQPLDPAPFTIPELDTRGYIAGGAR